MSETGEPVKISVRLSAEIADRLKARAQRQTARTKVESTLSDQLRVGAVLLLLLDMDKEDREKLIAEMKPAGEGGTPTPEQAQLKL